MRPALSQGDKIFIDQGYYATHAMQDGDIVVFRHNDILLIKRISALPGELIEGKDGILLRNGKPLNEPYLAPLTDGPIPELDTFAKRQLPSDQVFVTGDNRHLSLDSRSEGYGPVYTKDIVGKLAFVYYKHKQ